MVYPDIAKDGTNMVLDDITDSEQDGSLHDEVVVGGEGEEDGEILDASALDEEEQEDQGPDDILLSDWEQENSSDNGLVVTGASIVQPPLGQGDDEDENTLMVVGSAIDRRSTLHSEVASEHHTGCPSVQSTPVRGLAMGMVHDISLTICPDLIIQSNLFITRPCHAHQHSCDIRSQVDQPACDMRSYEVEVHHELPGEVQHVRNLRSKIGYRSRSMLSPTVADAVKQARCF